MRMKRHDSKAFFLPALLILLTAFPVSGAEFYIDLENSAGKADYLLGSRLVPDASYINNAFALNAILSENTRFYASASQMRVFPDSEYSTQKAEIGLYYRYLRLKDNQFYAGIFGYQNSYDEVYSYYESYGVGLHGKWKYFFNPGQLIIAGYDLTTKNFDEVEEASHTEHDMHIAYDHTFPSRTNFKIQTAIAIQEFQPQSTLTNFGRQYVIMDTEQIETNILNNLEVNFRQSLGSSLVFNVLYGSQQLLNDSEDSLAVLDGMNNPFIDRYRWEGESVSSTALLRLNDRNTLTISHAFNKRSFINVPVYEFDFQAMDYALINDEPVSLGYDREDERNSVYLTWKWSRPFAKISWLSSFEMLMSTGYIMNNSNDAIYDYDGMDYSISLNIYN